MCCVAFKIMIYCFCLLMKHDICFPDDPTVELSVVPGVEGSSSNPEKLVCSGTGFHPKITWLPKSEKKTDSVVTIVEDGRLKVYSEISVSQQEWNKGVIYKCTISDKLHTKTKSTSICSGNNFLSWYFKKICSKFRFGTT